MHHGFWTKLMAITVLSLFSACRASSPSNSVLEVFAGSDTRIVLGAVEEERRGEPVNGETLLEAVQASRPLEDADLTRVLLVRPSAGLERVVNVQEMLTSGDRLYNPALAAGDVVYVPRRNQPDIKIRVWPSE